jgi:hypothetical protein
MTSLRREKWISRHSALTCACKQTDLEDDIKKASVINRTRNILMFFLHILSLTCACKQTDLKDDICSAQTVTRIGLLEEIPRSGVQIPCLS